MTAVRDWEIVGPHNTDADLVRASLAGDRAAFGQMYDRYADRLHDFCIGMLHDRDGAADCVQDCFCVAATRLPQLRDPDKLRAWLYSIARNEALRRIRDRRRETPSDELPETASGDPGPDALAARTELADLIADAAGGLTERDRSVLELAFRHGLNGPDLADALGVTPTNANTIVHRLRDTIERSLGALVVARRVHSSGGCPELAAMLEGWDGHFNVLMRKRISRHIESCDSCDKDRRALASPAALLGAVPVFIPAPEWLRERTMSEVQLTCHGSQLDDDTDDGAASTPRDSGTAHNDRAGGGRRQRRLALAAALLIAVLGASLGLTFAWLKRDPVAIVPADVTDTAPESIAPTPAPNNAPPKQDTVQVKPTEPVVTVQPPPSKPEVQIKVPVAPPVGDSPSVPDPELTPELVPPRELVPPERPRSSGSSSEVLQEVPPAQTRPTGIAGAPQNPSSQQPRRAEINPASPDDNRRSSPTRRGVR
jgi:RNA polymerase sigma factor (sigma-70 family)